MTSEDPLSACAARVATVGLCALASLFSSSVVFAGFADTYSSIPYAATLLKLSPLNPRATDAGLRLPWAHERGR